MAQVKKSLVDEVLDDALQVRETALANAKLALEEAFEPRIKSMISRHLQNEVEDEEMEEGYGEEEMEEGEYGDEEEVSEEEDGSLEDVTNADDASIDEEESDDEMEEELEPSDIDDENEEPSDVASDSSEIGEESDEEMEEEMEDEMEEEDDLDLEAVIAELEAELGEEDEEEEEMEIDMDSDEEGEEEMEMDMDSEEDDEEIIDLDELLSALTEEDEEETVEEEEEEEVSELAQENSRLASELAEHREAVEILRSKLNEVNLLNAKLLYTTKLFRKFNLSNDQKMKVVESFDRTSSVRETKLVFSTLAESLSMNNSSKTKKKVASITEGFASKPTTSTKPKQQEIISEGNAVADRFRRLVSYNK